MKSLYYILLLVSINANGFEFKSNQSKKVAEQLIQVVNQKLAEIAALELAEGATTEEIKIDIFQQSRFDSGKFGAILSANKLGYILSVTPRGQAAAFGLKSGDTIVEVNGTRIADAGEEWVMLLQYLPNNAAVNIVVNRNKQLVELKGIVKAKFIPQWQLLSNDKISLTGEPLYRLIPRWNADKNSPIFEDGSEWVMPVDTESSDCGQVILVNSLSIAPPRFSGLKDTAVIKELDGEPWGDKSRQRVPVGNHHLEIGSKYDTPKEIKQLSINVEVNTNYYIAYVRNKPWVDQQGRAVEIGEYTGPVIWKTTTQACEM